MDLVSSQKHRRLPSFEICRSFTSDIGHFEEKDVAVRSGILQQGRPGCHIRPREKKVWVLYQQRKVPCKNRHRRCLATSEVTFCQNPSPAFLTRRAQQCSVAFHLEQDRISLTIILWRPVSTKLRARIMDGWRCHSYTYYEWKRSNISDRSESTVPPQQSIS